jgi:acetylornithine deacetylase/succinyl-diaminopimelate desuccinylase-like protein
MLDRVLGDIDTDLDNSLARLFDWLKIPSISTDPAYASQCREAAEWVRGDLESLGFQASLRETSLHPVVLGHLPKPGAPHVLFYGHYDVQPVDPLDLWEAPPFEPNLATIDGGRKVIRARGACDDKGQVMTFLEACRAWKATEGALPVGVTVLIEGAEENGSRGLPEWLVANKDELKADYVLVCDTGMWDRTTPAITTSLRGLLYRELIVRCADRDLHSGSFGGAARNPAHVLARIIADLHDETGRITLPGFYDGVPETPPEVLGALAQPQSHAGRVPGPGRPSRAGGRTGPYGHRADPVAPDLRRERDHRRLYRRGLEDGDRRRGAGQDLLSPRRRPGPGQDQRQLRGLRPRAHSGRLLGRVPEAFLRQSDPAPVHDARARKGEGRACG